MLFMRPSVSLHACSSAILAARHTSNRLHAAATHTQLQQPATFLSAMAATRSTLADFELECELGSGSFGCVHRAVRRADGLRYALKAIDLRHMSPAEQEDCIQETQLLASLGQCHHIIRFYDSFLQKGKLYIVMEYAPGGNLHDFIKRQPSSLPEAQVWRLFLQMLVGLNYMHQRKVLHRDFKTLNVFLDEHCNVRLGDLGVAKVLSAETRFAQTMIGTPYYMSPEMCEDRPYNEKSDVWALGVGLFECCTQRFPFDAENQGSLILKILRGRYPPVTGYSRELTDIIRACLTQDASKRPDTHALLALRAVRERAARLGVELPPVHEPAPALAAAPSRRGIAAGRSFTSMHARQSAAAEGDEPLPTIVTPAVVVLQPPQLPPAAPGSSSWSPTPPALGGLPSRGPSKRALLSPRDGSAGPAAAAAAVQGGARSLGALVVAPEVVGSKPQAGNSFSKRHVTGDNSPGGSGRSSINLQLQALRVGAASDSESAGRAGAACPSGHSSQAAAAPPGSAASDRSLSLQLVLPSVKNQIIALVGPVAFDALHAALCLDAAQAGDAGCGEQQPQLMAAVRSIVPGSQAAAVLPLLVKLRYVEGQLSSAM